MVVDPLENQGQGSAPDAQCSAELVQLSDTDAPKVLDHAAHVELQLYGHEAGGVASRNGPRQSLDGRDGEPTEEECTGSTVVRQPTIEPQVGSQLWLGAGEDGQVDGSGRQDAGAERANSRRDEYIEIFRQIDGNGDGQISQIEFIRALRRDSALALKLGLPHVIHQEDESRRLFESTFHELDADNSKTISLSEWLHFYVPDDPPPLPPRTPRPSQPDTPRNATPLSSLRNDEIDPSAWGGESGQSTLATVGSCPEGEPAPRTLGLPPSPRPSPVKQRRRARALPQHELEYLAPGGSSPTTRRKIRLIRQGLPGVAGIGLGLIVMDAGVSDALHGGVRIEAVFPDSPAHRCGEISVGDSVLSIDGEEVAALTAAQISQRIRGEPGAGVDLVIHSCNHGLLSDPASYITSPIDGIVF